MKRIKGYKRLVFTICGIVILVWTGNLFSAGQQPTVLQTSDTAYYFVDLPEGLDTIQFHASVQLNDSKKIHMLQFPNGGTFTSLKIVDSSFKSQNFLLESDQGSFTGSFPIEKKVLVNITGFKPGLYYVQYLSCNLGGLFELDIKKN